MTLAIGKRRFAAFTLAELLLTAAIMGLLAAVAWPTIGPLAKRISHRAQAQHWQELLRRARREAILTGEPQNVSFDRLPPTFSASAPGVTFLPDGSAKPVELRSSFVGSGFLTVAVDAMGRIETRMDSDAT